MMTRIRELACEATMFQSHGSMHGYCHGGDISVGFTPRRIGIVAPLKKSFGWENPRVVSLFEREPGPSFGSRALGYHLETKLIDVRSHPPRSSARRLPAPGRWPPAAGSRPGPGRHWARINPLCRSRRSLCQSLCPTAISDGLSQPSQPRSAATWLWPQRSTAAAHSHGP